MMHRCIKAFFGAVYIDLCLECWKLRLLKNSKLSCNTSHHSIHEQSLRTVLAGCGCTNLGRHLAVAFSLIQQKTPAEDSVNRLRCRAQTVEDKSSGASSNGSHILTFGSKRLSKTEFIGLDDVT